MWDSLLTLKSGLGRFLFQTLLFTLDPFPFITLMRLELDCFICCIPQYPRLFSGFSLFILVVRFTCYFFCCLQSVEFSHSLFLNVIFSCSKISICFLFNNFYYFLLWLPVFHLFQQCFHLIVQVCNRYFKIFFRKFQFWYYLICIYCLLFWMVLYCCLNILKPSRSLVGPGRGLPVGTVLCLYSGTLLRPVS